MLKIEYLQKEIPVYDITVEDNHNFFANDVLVHNCQEIILPVKPLEHIDDVGRTERRKVKVPKNKVEEYNKYKNSIGGVLYDF